MDLNFIKKLFELDELHQEYQDNDKNIVIDAKKEGDTLTIKIKFSEDKEKIAFENWVNELDDEIYLEVIDLLEEDGVKDLGELYKENPKLAIKMFKDRVREVVNSRIKDLKSILN